ncbi:MAG: TROVE domain-containing protein, partial [Minisyncoccia bacterium]
MARFGMKKGEGVHAAAHKETVAHKHVPGRAYDEFTSPSQKLVHMIGGGFFNEPRYYETGRSYWDFRAQLLKDGRITDTVLDKAGLNEQAREVLKVCRDVAESDNPEDLLILARWVRDPQKGLKLRTTAQIMLTMAAACEKTKQYVRKYAPEIVQRPDEVKQVFAAFRHLFQGGAEGKRHKGTLPHSLRKGLAQAIANFPLYQILKYDGGSERPTFMDVLRMLMSKKLPRKAVRRKKDEQSGQYVESIVDITATGYPLSKAVFRYLETGEVLPDAPEMIKQRDAFFKLGKGDLKKVTPAMLETAGLTWENMTSHFGASKEVWEMCIQLMGEMALTRNLRNFEEAKISQSAWDVVYEKCGKIKETCQLPFRFFTALKQTTSTESKTLVSLQLDASVQNVPDLPGVTVVLVDNSGSAVGASISGKSDMRVSDAGNTLGAILAKRLGRRCIVGCFGDSVVWVPFSQADSTLRIKEIIDAKAQTEERSKNGALGCEHNLRGHGVGGGTETGLWFAIDDLTKRKLVVNRIIMISDLC